MDAYLLTVLIFAQLKLGAHGFSYQRRYDYLADFKGATIAIPSKSGSYIKTYKNNSTTTLLAGGYNEDGHVSLSCRPACMLLYLAIGNLLMSEDVLGFAKSS